VVDLSVIIS